MKKTGRDASIRISNQEMTAQTCANVLQATKESLASKGYAGTSLTSVAKGLGLTQPALSYHYSTKSQLMAAVAISIYDEMANLYRKAAPASLNAGERMLALIEAAYEQTGSTNQMALIELLLAARRDPQCREAVAPIIAQRDQEFEQVWHSLVEQLPGRESRLELLRDLAVSLYRGMTVNHALANSQNTFALQHAVIRRLFLESL